MSSQAKPSLASPASAFRVAAGEDRLGGTLHVFGAETSVKISSHDSSGAYSVMEATTPVDSGPPLHLHQREDEWWYILEGDYLFEIDGTQLHAGPGDTVFAPRGSRHTFQNVGTTPGKTLVTVVPGGLDLFFQEISAAVLPGTTPEPAVIMPIFAKYGLELLGPPLNRR